MFNKVFVFYDGVYEILQRGISGIWQHKRALKGPTNSTQPVLKQQKFLHGFYELAYVIQL